MRLGGNRVQRVQRGRLISEVWLPFPAPRTPPKSRQPSPAPAPRTPPKARLRFALEADAPERVAFANGFAILDDDDVDWQALAGCVEPKAEAMGSDPTPTQGPSQPIQFYQQKMVFFCIDIVGKLGWVGRGLEWSPSQPIQFHHYVDAKKYIFCG